MIELPISALRMGEEYRRQRATWRRRSIEAKSRRRVMLGSSLWLNFENLHTVLGQIQEVLHIESTESAKRIAQVIQEYMPLLPTSEFVVATLMTSESQATKLERLGSAIDQGLLSLTLGTTSCHAAPLSAADRSGPVRYLRFPLKQSDKLEFLRTSDLAALTLSFDGRSLSQPLSRAWVEDSVCDVSEIW